MLTRNGTWRKDETLALLYFFFFTSSAPTGGKKKKIKNVPYVMTNKITKDEAFIFAADFPMDLLNFRLVVIRISNKPSKA